MISRVTTSGFHGVDAIDQLLKKLNLIVGANGSGKSAMIQAIQLAVMGYIIGKDKRNPVILDTFGSNGKKMTVGIELNNTFFERRFTRSGDSVTQNFLVDGQKYKKDDFISAMADSGKPVILDLEVFNKLSDEKKIDVIFELFPPADGLEQVSEDIEKKNTELNSLREKLRSSEKIVKGLTAAKAKLEVPPGTLAECQDLIKKHRKELDDTKQELTDQRAREKAESEAKEKAEKERQEAEDERKRQQEAAKSKPDIIEEPFFPELDEKTPEAAPSVGPQSTIEPLPVSEVRESEAFPDPAASIRVIIESIESVGCPICANGAAKMVAKRELAKFS